MDTLWRLVLDAPEAVSAEARSLLVALHTQLGGSIGDHSAAIRAAFLRCGEPPVPAPQGRNISVWWSYMVSHDLLICR